MIATGVFILPAKGNTVYDLNYTTPSGAAVAGTVTGTITLNMPPQPFGVVGQSNVLDWNITMTAGGLTAQLLGPLQVGANSTINIGTTTLQWTATAANITANFGNPATGGLIDIGSTPGTRLCWSNALTEGCGGAVIGGDVSWQIMSGSTAEQTGIGVPAGNIVATAEITTTPLPAALPLFATGIGGLGLLGWRRKRKARAVVS
jgi:hypothetical protein